MVPIPDKDFDHEDEWCLADWVELWCLTSPQRELPTGEIADVLHDSLSLEEPEEPDLLTPQERASEYADRAVAVARSRRHMLCAGYPIEVERDTLVSPGHWSSSLCYTSLLLADVGRLYTDVATDFVPGGPFPRLFEKVVQVALSCIFGGISVRFGWPREPSWPTSICDRIEHLAEEMGLEAMNPKSSTFPDDKDIGLDVVTRIKIGDEEAGTAVVLTQCATGKDFANAKVGEPSLALWGGLVRWQSRLIRGVAFPWRRDMSNRRFARLASKLEAMLFDRMRLFAAGNPDSLLDAVTRSELTGWCEARIAELPLE